MHIVKKNNHGELVNSFGRKALLFNYVHEAGDPL